MGKVGNLYSQLSIQNAIERGKNYDPDSINQLSEKYMCIDPAFSSSKFAILVGEWFRSEKQIRILYAEELDHPSYEEAVDHIFRLTKQLGNIKNIGVDGSNPELIVSLKKKIDERSDWKYIQEKSTNLQEKKFRYSSVYDVVPIVLTLKILTSCSHSKRLLDDSRELIAINSKFSKLITALRGAILMNIN